MKKPEMLIIWILLKNSTKTLKKSFIESKMGTSADDYLKNLGNDGVLTLDENKILMEVQ